MITARKVGLRVNGVRAVNARVRRSEKSRELVITDPRFGEFAADETFTLELLELAHRTKSGRICQTGAGGEFRYGH
jgi:hypothetical protein